MVSAFSCNAESGPKLSNFGKVQNIYGTDTYKTKTLRTDNEYIYIHTYIHICWFNFDALAQGNAYKPTKEPINYRGPDGDRTHDLQTEATPPAASCPARTLHATEIAPKNATPMTCPWLHWTTDNLSGMHAYIHTYTYMFVVVNFDALAQASDIRI